MSSPGIVQVRQNLINLFVFLANPPLSLYLPAIADPHVSPNLDISRIGARIIDELVVVMKDVGIDDTEFACIKALVFFDPSKWSFKYVSSCY